jgi:NADPH:quinone reductase-like Zn-dependent oxidoreductase
VELVRSVGATQVVDYLAQDFTRVARGFDALVDIAGSPSVWAARRVLRQGGTYVVVGGRAGRWFRPVDHIIAASVMGKLARQPVAVTGVAIGAASARHLAELAPLLDSGKVTPVVARRYTFAELPEAVRFVEAGHAPGKVVVAIE